VAERNKAAVRTLFERRRCRRVRWRRHRHRRWRRGRRCYWRRRRRPRRLTGSSGHHQHTRRRARNRLRRWVTRGRRRRNGRCGAGGQRHGTGHSDRSDRGTTQFQPGDRQPQRRQRNTDEQRREQRQPPGEEALSGTVVFDGVGLARLRIGVRQLCGDVVRQRLPGLCGRGIRPNRRALIGRACGHAGRGQVYLAQGVVAQPGWSRDEHRYSAEQRGGVDQPAAVLVTLRTRLDMARNALAHQDAELAVPACQDRDQLRTSVLGGAGAAGNQRAPNER
jgi:hypothetical protein